jgi:cytidylate kinase
MIIGVSGRKQSGKSTVGNLIYSFFMSQLDVSEKIFLSESGEIIVSDLYGEKSYEGIFDPYNTSSTDFLIAKCFEALSKSVKIYSFADALKKDICINILGLEYRQCYGTDDEKNEITHLIWEGKNISAREAMQFIGTDIFRTMYNNVWVEATLKKIMKEGVPLAIITDCRFPNEVESIKSNGGKVIRLTRDPFHSDHISESILDKENYDWSNFDYVIDNNNNSLYEQSVLIKKTIEEILQLS